MADTPQKITDAKTLRALAHPLRWELMDLLRLETTATATRCAEVTGESVASCSYHLNMLAKYGFVQEATGGQGREKPWRLIRHDQSWSEHGAGMDAEGTLVAQSLTNVFLDHETANLKRWIRREGEEPEAWQEATGMTGVTTFLTVEEMHGLTRELREVATRYSERGEDPSNRPAGARAVRIFVTTSLAGEQK